MPRKLNYPLRNDPLHVDWDHGTWSRRGGESAPDHRVVVAGDWAPRRGYERLVTEAPAAVYADLLPVLRDADLGIVNLEAPLSRVGSPIAKDGPNLRLNPDVIAGLTVVPFGVACLANNHTMDFGAEALGNTLRTLHDRGIRTVGAGLEPGDAHSPLIVALGELRLGIVNFCEGEDGTTAVDGPGVFGWELDRVVKIVGELRGGVDVLMVIAHVGREYVPAPPPYVQRVFRSIAEAGADVLIGHHPHVPQGIEVYEGVPLVYSLGNFVFHPQRVSLFQHRGFLLSIDLTAGEVSGFDLIPYAVTEEGLRRVTGPEREWLYRQLRCASEILDDPRRVEAVWHAFIDSFGKAFWRRKTHGRVAALFRRLLGRGKSDYRREAAKLRNRFLTPAHRHFMADGLDRLGRGQLGRSEAWAVELVRRWRVPEFPG